LVLLLATPQERKIKPPLQVISSAEKVGIFKTSENGVDNTISLKSGPSEGSRKGNNIDKVSKL
jgi:synaptonemal complex protein 2